MLRWLAFSLIPVFLEALLAPVPFATDFSGSVVSVLDGDSLEVLHDQHSERIRLRGIDGPVCHNSEW